MPRRNAAERHQQSKPAQPAALGAEAGNELLEVLIAYHHPTRRWIAEVLSSEGPATVGQLAERSGLAVGSISHHVKALHKHGFIEPAPERARDSRESWWKNRPRAISWDSADFEEGSVGRRVARAAEVENFKHQVRAVQEWIQTSADEDPQWRHAALSTDSLVSVTLDQLNALNDRLSAVAGDWLAEVKAGIDPGETATPDASPERRPVRIMIRTFPSGAVRR